MAIKLSDLLRFAPAAGAVTGGIIGSVIPGAGTMAGSAIGGAVGALGAGAADLLDRADASKQQQQLQAQQLAEAERLNAEQEKLARKQAVMSILSNFLHKV